jgi:hypothetical protein
MQIVSILAQSSLAFDVGYWVKAIMIIAGVIGVLYVILRQCDVRIPPFIVQIFWILLTVVIGCIAVGFLMRMM